MKISRIKQTACLLLAALFIYNVSGAGLCLAGAEELKTPSDMNDVRKATGMSSSSLIRAEDRNLNIIEIRNDIVMKDYLKDFGSSDKDIIRTIAPTAPVNELRLKEALKNIGAGSDNNAGGAVQGQDNNKQGTGMEELILEIEQAWHQQSEQELLEHFREEMIRLLEDEMRMIQQDVDNMALTLLDTNHDGVIDSNDEGFDYMQKVFERNEGRIGFHYRRGNIDSYGASSEADYFMDSRMKEMLGTIFVLAVKNLQEGTGSIQLADGTAILATGGDGHYLVTISKDGWVMNIRYDKPDNDWGMSGEGAARIEDAFIEVSEARGHFLKYSGGLPADELRDNASKKENKNKDKKHFDAVTSVSTDVPHEKTQDYIARSSPASTTQPRPNTVPVGEKTALSKKESAADIRVPGPAMNDSEVPVVTPQRAYSPDRALPHNYVADMELDGAKEKLFKAIEEVSQEVPGAVCIANAQNGIVAVILLEAAKPIGQGEDNKDNQ